MAKRGSLLAQIESGVLDDAVPLTSLLQKCVVLGGQAGSEQLRDWARQELHGYTGETVPDYRRFHAALMVMITNPAGYNGIARRIDDSVFPAHVRDMIREKVDLEEVVLAGGIGTLEAMACQGSDEHQLVPSWASFIADTLNQFSMAPSSRAAEVYWLVPNASVQGLLSRVRTALAELVAELTAMTPPDQEVPDRRAADQATHLIITGDRPTINYSPQNAGDGGTNVAAVGAAAPVTVSGGHGSQATTAGRDATATTGSTGPAVHEGWWARLRKRGMIVAFAIIIGSIAAVAAAIVAIFTWLGWTP